MKSKIRKAKIEDSNYVFNLVNEPTTLKVSFHQKPITRKEHDIWYENAIHSSEVLYFIIENEVTNESVGQIRVNSEGTVSLTIGEKYRGLGFAPESVLNLIDYLENNEDLPEVDFLYAYIREQNIKSSKTFVRVGFQKAGTKELYGHECIIHEFKLKR